MIATADGTQVLEEPEWRERQRHHEARVRQWTDPHHARTARGEHHPVYQFLFGYYGFRPSWLRRWHPGFGITLRGAGVKEFLGRKGYSETSDGIQASTEMLTPKRREMLHWLHALLVATRDRPAFFGCFGFHEWAMVYRENQDTLRHASWPLRFSLEEIARIVERHSLCCTHHDAFRFFTPQSRPLNRWQPERHNVRDHEQRGCLHANMDLYKWSFKLTPLTPSELVADCFCLAREIREIDMRASPYDFRALGFDPIPIETPEGRAEYEAHQREFSARGEPLRARLIAICATLLAVPPGDTAELAEREPVGR